MTKVRGEREQKVRQGPGVTSGLGGRGDLRLPRELTLWEKCGCGSQTNKQKKMSGTETCVSSFEIKFTL